MDNYIELGIQPVSRLVNRFPHARDLETGRPGFTVVNLESGDYWEIVELKVRLLKNQKNELVVTCEQLNQRGTFETFTLKEIHIP